MNKTKSIVIYTSKRGSAKQYAEWIAEDLDCEAVALPELLRRTKSSKANDSQNGSDYIDLCDHDCIIYGGWIRGSGIVDFDKFSRLLDDELMSRLIVYGVGIADETADNYTQVWNYSIGKLDPKNDKRILLYILGGRYDPQQVRGFDGFLMKVMRTVLISGSTAESKGRAVFMRDRIDKGVDLVKRENTASLVKDAKKKTGNDEKEKTK